MQLQQTNPTLKGRLLNLERQAKRMKEVIGQSETDIRSVIGEIQEGTEATILNDKIAFIRDLLSERLELINYKQEAHQRAEGEEQPARGTHRHHQEREAAPPGPPRPPRTARRTGAPQDRTRRRTVLIACIPDSVIARSTATAYVCDQMARVRRRFWFSILRAWMRICSLDLEALSLGCPHSLRECRCSWLPSKRFSFCWRASCSSIRLFWRMRPILETESVRKERPSSLAYWLLRLRSARSSCSSCRACLPDRTHYSLSAWHCCSSSPMQASSSRMASSFSSTASATFSQLRTTSWMFLPSSSRDSPATLSRSCASSSSRSPSSAYSSLHSSSSIFCLEASSLLSACSRFLSSSLRCSCRPSSAASLSFARQLAYSSSIRAWRKMTLSASSSFWPISSCHCSSLTCFSASWASKAATVSSRAAICCL